MENKDAYQTAMQKMLADNAQAAQNMVEVARQEREKAALALQEAQAELARNIQEADAIRADLEEKKFQQYKLDFLAPVQDKIVHHLQQSGYDMDKIAQLLGLPLAAIRRMLGQKPSTVAPPAGIEASVAYQQDGRSGLVILTWNGQKAQFWWEFGGDGALAIINIPDAQKWTTQTGIAMEERDQALQFMAANVVRDQASSGGRYTIEDNFITIYGA
jgi:hypothetical protein